MMIHTVEARFSPIFPKTQPSLLFNIRFVQQCAAISATDELLFYNVAFTNFALSLNIGLT